MASQMADFQQSETLMLYIPTDIQQQPQLCLKRQVFACNIQQRNAELTIAVAILADSAKETSTHM